MFQAPVIDMGRTGKRIRQLCMVNGYTVRRLQEYLQIVCPQSIYNWYHGKTLPSLDHLFALSVLLHIPMNWLLVAEATEYERYRKRRFGRMPQMRRLVAYKNIV
ncbi:MAG: helix-turn-helix transcriptional regulator [Lachnospiraceae bacterium]|nr:helix-turn-helix transcriptional regulator [Lachnospiraceae bacterium]